MRSNVLINHTLSTALGTIDKHLQIFNKPTLSEYQYKFDLNHEHEIELVHSTFGEIGLKKRKSPNILYVCIASNKYTVMNSCFLYHAWGLYHHKCLREEYKGNTIILHIESKRAPKCCPQ